MTGARAVASPHVVCIEDFRPLARRRIPKAVFDYLDGGAEGEVTLRENCRAFQDITFRPRHAVALASCAMGTRVLGFDLALPFLLAPVGYSRLMHPGGEVAAARAAGAAGTAYILSTISGHKLENVKAGSTGPVFYQLYLMGGRGAAEAAIERARVAGFSALVVTIDTAVSGIRERDYRNGMKELISGTVFEKIPYIPELLKHPGWLMDYLRDGGLPGLPNVIIPGKGQMPLVDINAALAAAAVMWTDLRWIREHWKGPIVVKGVLTADDARRAVDEGAAAISVSNHGGRRARWSASLGASLARSGEGGERPDRGVDGRRCSPRHRRCQSHLPGCTRGSVWTRLCVWPRSGRGSRSNACHRNPAN